MFLTVWNLAWGAVLLWTIAALLIVGIDVVIPGYSGGVQ